jgi:signal peptide peptidase SppA
MQLQDLLAAPWAIAPHKLLEMQAIYATHLRGEALDIDAIEARLGRPLANEQQEYSMRDGGVAVLPIQGVIAPKANMFTRVSGGVSAQMLGTQLDSMLADQRVRSILLAYDSPGGSVFGNPEFASAVAEAAAIKPVVAISDGMLASAAYWSGSAANAVYITGPTVQVGSIGVVASHKFDPRAAETTTEITAGRYKRVVSDSKPLTPEGREYLQAQVDHLYTVFVEAVAQHRGITAAQVMAHMADGQVFTGQQAIDVGLVDGMVGMEALIQQMAATPERFAQRRTARIAALVATPPAKSKPAAARVVAPPSSSTTKGSTMDRQELEAAHPELLRSILAEGRAAGAAAECARIQGVEAALIPGHERLIASLKFDGKTMPGDAALAINSAERGLREAAATANANAAAQPLPQAPAAQMEASPEALAAVARQAAEAAAQSRAPQGYAVDGARAELHAKAIAHMAEHPKVSYIDAVKAVQKGQ